MSDSDLKNLILLAQSGDKRAFRQVVTSFYGLVMHFLIDSGLCFHDAEDVAQETFLNAHRSLGQYSGSGSFANWLLKIAKNKKIDWYRREKKTKGNECLDECHEPSRAIPIEEAVISQASVEGIFQELGSRERVIMDLRLFQRTPFAEIAQTLSVTEGCVRLIFHRALGKLRKRWQGAGKTSEETRM